MVPVAGAALIDALNNWRHAVRAAVLFSLNAHLERHKSRSLGAF